MNSTGEVYALYRTALRFTGAVTPEDPTIAFLTLMKFDLFKVNFFTGIIEGKAVGCFSSFQLVFNFFNFFYNNSHNHRKTAKTA